jgi:outer membrane murein-binding lipoprotein Lpp
VEVTFMASESRQEKLEELASTIDELKTTVDELAADPLPDTNATSLNAVGTALEHASDAADDLIEDEDA